MAKTTPKTANPPTTGMAGFIPLSMAKTIATGTTAKAVHRSAIRSAWGSVTAVSANVDVRGTAPGMLATP